MAKKMLLGILAGLFLICASLPFESNVTAAPRRAQRSLAAHGLRRAQRSFVPHELLVKFKSQTPGFVRAQINRGAGARVIHRFRGDSRLELLRLPAGDNLDSAIAYYSTRADVEYVQRNYIYRVQRTDANDPSYGDQWALGSVNAPAAWDKTTGRFNVIVAVIDTGVDYTHPDLGLNIWTNPAEAGLNCSDGVDNDNDGYVDDCRGWDFYNHTNNPTDDLNHGTQVAGVIGAMGDNGIGVAGSNWNVQIMPLRVTNADGGIPTAVAVDAIDYAIEHGASIINASWGGPDYDSAMLEAVLSARDAGVLFVTEAGDANSDNDSSPFFPCNYTQYGATNVICAASVNQSDMLGYYSNYGGTTVQLGAPGDNVLTTGSLQPPFTYPYVGGTMTGLAAGYVTGGAALLKGCKASLDSSTIRTILLTNTRDDGYLTGQTSTGGVVDFQAALDDPLVGSCDSTATSSTPVADGWGPYNYNLRNMPIRFNGSRSSDTGGQLLIYFWDFGDGTYGVGPKPLHTYVDLGSYTATLYVRDDQGVIASESVTVNVRPNNTHIHPNRNAGPTVLLRRSQAMSTQRRTIYRPR